jgi:hypothetical protein
VFITDPFRYTRSAELQLRVNVSDAGLKSRATGTVSIDRLSSGA